MAGAEAAAAAASAAPHALGRLLFPTSIREAGGQQQQVIAAPHIGACDRLACKAVCMARACVGEMCVCVRICSSISLTASAHAQMPAWQSTAFQGGLDADAGDACAWVDHVQWSKLEGHML